MNSLQARINTSVSEALARLCIESSWRTYSGRCQAQLIESVGTTLGCQFAGLASSGSAALEILLRACGLGPSDEVMLSGYDYPGNFAAIERVGARPVLVDLRADSWQLCLGSLEESFTPDCKVLIASHLHGQLQPLRELSEWCHNHNVYLIQDACQALGSSFEKQGREVEGPRGGETLATDEALGQWGDATLLSFGGTKVISAGRGGAWATNNAALGQRAIRAAGVGSGAYEMSELQAAVAMAQWPYLAEITRTCRVYFEQLNIDMHRVIPGMQAPWWSHRLHTAFYQAGWLLPHSEDRQLAMEMLTQYLASKGTIAGQGFAGFHRRSARRARVHRPLVNVEDIVHRSVTVHHRIAIATSES